MKKGDERRAMAGDNDVIIVTISSRILNGRHLTAANCKEPSHFFLTTQIPFCLLPFCSLRAV